MLKNISQFMQLEMLGTDAPYGRPVDILFDESDWSVRALAFRPGWHAGRKVLVPVGAISKISWESREAQLALDHSATLSVSAELRDQRLRSANEVSGFSVSARGVEFGCVEDFVMDTSTWSLRYLVVGTGSETPETARPVHFAPQWAARIDWVGREVLLDVSLSTVQNSPIPSTLDRAYEEKLYSHYGHLQMRYWIDPDHQVRGEIHVKH